MNILSIVAGLISPVTEIFKKREERRLLKESAAGKLAAAKQKGEQDVTLTDAEWESLSVNKQDSTWKDEYVTVVVTSPMVLILLGGIYGAFSGDMRLIEGTIAGVTALAALNVDMGELMLAVVLAAIGLKVWRGR